MDSKVILALIGSAVVIFGLTALLFIAPTETLAPQSDVSTTTEMTAPAATKPAVKTVASSVSTAGAGARTFEKGVYVTTIYFTTKGFVPQTLVIDHGEEVRFVNKTTLTMRVGSQTASNASSLHYSAISDPRAQPKGGTYQISLTQPGIWSYYNLTGQPFTGSVTVK